MDKWTILLIAWMVAGVVSACVVGLIAKKPKKPPCETCKWLNFKFCKGSRTYRYRCGVQGGFDKPPLYCKDYERPANKSQVEISDLRERQKDNTKSSR